jgi:hypothetical protein
MAKKSAPRGRWTVIFRRYRRTKTGQLLDARKYGLRAWPIRVWIEAEAS